MADSDSGIPFFIDELQNKLSAKDFQTLQSKIRLDQMKESFPCFDEKGNEYDYARENICPNKDSSVKAINWLNITEPDYYD